MGSVYTQELSWLLDGRFRDRCEVHPRLLRLASAIDERVSGVDASSIEFVRSAVRVVRKLHPALDSELQFRCLTSAVPYLYAHAEVDAALLAANGMVLIGRQTGRRDLERKGLNFLGIIDKTAGNYADAVVHLQQALGLAQEVQDIRGEISVLGNLGGTLVEAALHREGMACFERAIQLSHACDLGDPQVIEDRAMILVNQSHLCLRVGDLKTAYKLAQRSLTFWLEPQSLKDFVSRTLRAAHYVYLCLELGKLDDAVKHADKCRMYSSRNPTPPSRFYAQVASGLIQVATGNSTDGLQILQGARQLSGQIQQTTLGADAWISLAWAYEQLNRPEEALTCLQALREGVTNNRKRVVAVMLQRTSDTEAADHFDFLALDYREARLESQVCNRARLNSEIDLLQRLAITATLRDDPSGLHGYRVGRLAALLAKRLGWNPQQCWSLEICGRMHDIGKTGLPDHILLNREVLKNADLDVVQTHSTIGHALLSKAQSSDASEAAVVALCHHERWDGSGYPTGLVGDRIPTAARIVALADVFDALTHGRPYAKSWSIDRAINEIRNQAGHQFDPDMASAFVEMVSETRARHWDLDAFLAAGAESSPFIAARREIQNLIQARATPA